MKTEEKNHNTTLIQKGIISSHKLTKFEIANKNKKNNTFIESTFF